AIRRRDRPLGEDESLLHQFRLDTGRDDAGNARRALRAGSSAEQREHGGRRGGTPREGLCTTDGCLRHAFLPSCCDNCYSILSPISGMICFQRGTSPAMRARSTSAPVRIIVIPTAAAFSLSAGSSRALASSACRRVAMPSGSPRGASSAYQLVAT